MSDKGAMHCNHGVDIDPPNKCRYCEAEYRAKLEDRVGPVWNTEELQRDFEVIAFLAPYVTVRSKKTGKSGTMQFDHLPRYYYDFRES